MPAGQVADELAVLQRRADGPPGPGVQHGRQLPEVSQQQELHVGVQPHAGQVRPERHVQLREPRFCAEQTVHRLALLSQPRNNGPGQVRLSGARQAREQLPARQW